MTALYNKLLSDLLRKDENSFIYRHHINYVNRTFYKRDVPYLKTEPHQIVVDYIASMTDDYFIDLFKLLFPDSGYSLDYVDYFKDKKI